MAVTSRWAVILAALFSPQLSIDEAQSLLAQRPYDGWGSVDDFLAEPLLSKVNETIKSKANAFLNVDSSYFELDTQVIVNDSRVRLRSLLYSEDRKTVKVIRRRFGGVSE